MGSKYYGQIHANDNSKLHLGDINYYGDQERLRHVPGALFNAYGADHRACHFATRRELLDEIKGWAEHSTGKSIFWLNGMAGTGKSTIAYTIAEWLSQQGPPGRTNLGASFFFKRGERDRASAALFFPTIVRQLRQTIPDLAKHVDHAIDIDPDICSKALSEQFDKLLEGPLRKLGDSSLRPTYVVVVDALDECQEEDDVRTLLQLWSRLCQMPYLSIQWFLTSRPELPIQLGFSRMSADARRNMILHEVPRPTIEHDIAVFLADSFSQIKNDYNFAPLSGTHLSEDWPGAAVLEELTQMAVPLFIIAATISRFIEDQDFDPQEQLKVILQSRRIGQISSIGQLYLPILQRVISASASPTIQKQQYNEFQLIVGAVITIAEPLSRLDLSALLKLSPATVALRLRSLHSVLQIPQQAEAPIRLLHLSFAEFLSSEELRDQPFWIDRAAIHAVLLTKCLELLSQPSPVGLCENMCQLSYSGQSRRDVAHMTVQSRLRPAIQYACRYWTYHFQHSRIQIYDDGDVHKFLKKHFLHWLEASSLMECLGDALKHINTLQSLLPVKGSTGVVTLLQDARRFVLANRYICDRAPLQLYSSAVVFAPQGSIVRNICGEVPSWIQRYPVTPKTWSAELQKLEGHLDGITAVAFSPNGLQLASGSSDRTVRLWDTKTGQELQKLEGHTWGISAVAFSPDGSQFASGSNDCTIRLWDTKMGQEIQKLEGHTGTVSAVAFSPDGSLLASGASYDWALLLWDTKMGQEVQKLVHFDRIKAVAFSPDGLQFASGAYDRAARLWDSRTGQELQQLEGQTNRVTAVALSPGGSQLALGSEDQTVRLWDTRTGQEVQKLGGQNGFFTAVAFSPDGLQLASGSDDRTIRLWDTNTGQEVQKLRGHIERISVVAYSPNGLQLASGSYDRTVRLWDTKTGQELQKLEGNTWRMSALAFSPDGSQLASGSEDQTVRLWDSKTGQQLQIWEDYPHVSRIRFTKDSQALLTNRGNIYVGTSSPVSETSKATASNSFVFKHDWIESGGRRVLWLPHEYRSRVSDVHGNILAIGRASGLVTFLDIQYV